MLVLNFLYRNAVPEIDHGTGDLSVVDGASGYPALKNQAGNAPSYDTLGTIYAEVYSGSGNWNVAEYMVLFPVEGQSPPALVADVRHTTPSTLRMRNAWGRFESLSAFQSAVTTFRQQLGEAMVCLEALGRRYTDLQSDLSAAGFPNVTQGVETYDLYAAGTSNIVGCAFIGRTASNATSQHWVLYSSQAFDNIKIIKRTSNGYASTQAFLTAMAALRANTSVAFRHAFEQATHYADVPW